MSNRSNTAKLNAPRKRMNQYQKELLANAPANSKDGNTATGLMRVIVQTIIAEIKLGVSADAIDVLD